MVKIRLSRGGARKKPYYHIVVMDQRQRRDGRCLERIGSYDPNLETSERVLLNIDRLNYWVSKGAQMSNRVLLLKKYSQDEQNIENRTRIKNLQLEKAKAKRLAKKEEVVADKTPEAEAATPEAEAATPEAEAASPEAEAATPEAEAATPESSTAEDTKPAEEKPEK